MSRRGGMETTLVVLILAMISAVVLGIFVYNYIHEARGKEAEKICQLSIYKSAQLKALGKEVLLQTSPLECDRTELTIAKADVVENGNINQQKASGILAEAMRECWQTVGEGKTDPFTAWNNKGQSYCLVCNTIKFDPALKKFMQDSKTGIKSPVPYLVQTNMPGMVKTYWQYLYNSEPRFDQSALTSIAANRVQEDSLILLSMYKPESHSTIATIIGGAVGILVGGPVGAAVLVYDVGSAFASCPECNGVGGIALVPPGMDLTQTLKVNVQGAQADVPVCSIMVN